MNLPDHKHIVKSRVQDQYGQEMMKWRGKGINKEKGEGVRESLELFSDKGKTVEYNRGTDESETMIKTDRSHDMK